MASSSDFIKLYSERYILQCQEKPVIRQALDAGQREIEFTYKLDELVHEPNGATVLMLAKVVLVASAAVAHHIDKMQQGEVLENTNATVPSPD